MRPAGAKSVIVSSNTKQLKLNLFCDSFKGVLKTMFPSGDWMKVNTVQFTLIN